MSSIKVLNLSNLIDKLDEISKADLRKPLDMAAFVVENAAKENCPVGSGELRNSIQHQIDDSGTSATIGTNLLYAPYVEYGTGIYARDGNGRQGYWVFVKGSDGSMSKHNQTQYTLEEAKQIMASMRSQGLDAFYTNGQRPHPYLEPALTENTDKIVEVFDKYLMEEIKHA